MDPAGVEPAFPARQAGVVPLDHRPRSRSVETMGVEPNAGCVRGTLAPSAHASPCQRSCWESNPDRHHTRVVCRRNTSRPGSCGGRIRTGVERLMRPCWKPDSSPLRSDQGESRTPMPLQARRSERRVSAGSTTWPGSPYGDRTHPSGLRGRRPFADRRTGRQCVEQELNLHSPKAAALQTARLANAQPTHVVQ